MFHTSGGIIDEIIFSYRVPLCNLICFSQTEILDKSYPFLYWPWFILSGRTLLGLVSKSIKHNIIRLFNKVLRNLPLDLHSKCSLVGKKFVMALSGRHKTSLPLLASVIRQIFIGIREQSFACSLSLKFMQFLRVSSIALFSILVVILNEMKETDPLPGQLDDQLVEGKLF